MKVIYFSRSGNSERIAGKISKELDCSKIRMTDDVSWKGILGWIKGGFYSLNGKKTNIQFEDKLDTETLDTVILVVPLWAGNTAPAGYSFLDKYKGDIKKLYMVICNDGSSTDKAFNKLEGSYGTIENKYGITKSLNNEDSVINNLINDIKV